MATELIGSALHVPISPGPFPMSMIISVNVGTPRMVEFRGQAVSTGIYKSPVDGPVRVEGVNVAGDDQADRRVHGGEHKAVYAYAAEDYAWWSDRLGRTLAAGTFGDNLTTDGIDLGDAVVGQRWRINDVVLQISEPRMPCYKLGIRMEDPAFPTVFSEAGRPGSYLRIIEAGSLASGDHIEVGHTPSHGLTVSEIARIYDRDQHEAGRFLEAAELSEPWKRWARRFASP